MSLFGIASDSDSRDFPSFVLPAEFERQTGVIMAWPTAESIEAPVNGWEYPNASVDATRRELAAVARAIASFEPVHVFIRDPKEYAHQRDRSGHKAAQRAFRDVANVTLHVTPNVDSLWVRDSGPTFVRTRNGEPLQNVWHADDRPGIGFARQDTASATVGLLLGFNQWGRSLEPSADAFFAPTACQAMNVSAVLAPFIAEGGGIEVDGEGTMIATESCLLNMNRNPGISRKMLEAYFNHFLGVDKVVWLPGSRGEDITDGHVDALARFASPGTMILSRPFMDANDPTSTQKIAQTVYDETRSLLERATDAKGRQFRIVDVQEPNPTTCLGRKYLPQTGPCLSYVNFLIINGAVIVAQFGDVGPDQEALKLIEAEFPGRQICGVRLHELAIQGGGVHCATKQF